MLGRKGLIFFEGSLNMSKFYHSGRMKNNSNEEKKAALEREADALLWNSGADPRYLAYSFYREKNLRRACRKEAQFNTPPPPDLRMLQESAAQLLEMLLAQTTLTESERQIIALRRQGLTLRQMAQSLGIKHSTAARWLQRAIRKLREFWEQQAQLEANEDWQAAFNEQRTISVYQPERHCRPGQEACRKDGLCKYRWYLYYEAPRD